MPLPKAPTKPAHILTADELAAVAATSISVQASATPTTETTEAATSNADKKPSRRSRSKKSTASTHVADTPELTDQTTVATMAQGQTAALFKSTVDDTAPNTPALNTVKPTTSVSAPTTPAQPTLIQVETKPAAKTTTTTNISKLFVLDTNVLMHDPSSLFRFEEHDIFLPMMTLEELDNNKKGMSEVARNARQASRSLDALIANTHTAGHLQEGIKLNRLGHRDAQGKLFFQTQMMAGALPASLPVAKADNQILGVAKALQDSYPHREVVLVSKDINMRIKASTLGIVAQDYLNDQVIEDTDLLYSGALVLPANFWEQHANHVESWQQAGQTYYKITAPIVSQFLHNQFVYIEGDSPLYATVKEIHGKSATLQVLRDYTHPKNGIWGVTARNKEQNFAMNLLMNPNVDFITLLGQAGTGKTLLTIAAALMQTLDIKLYSEIIMTRVTVSVGEDIGFLPGTEEEKMAPWMGALEDNLDVLIEMGHGSSAGAGGEWGRTTTKELIKSKIKIKSVNFMRGRTFLNKFLIVDEAQNLTPKQIKTLITRAGPGTKVVCLGNIAQIDTPYLTEGSSGLTYVVDRFKNWAHSGHITLQRGERSRLADFAADVL
jgi:PhoH-like ATPase